MEIKDLDGILRIVDANLIDWAERIVLSLERP